MRNQKVVKEWKAGKLMPFKRTWLYEVAIAWRCSNVGLSADTAPARFIKSFACSASPSWTSSQSLSCNDIQIAVKSYVLSSHARHHKTKNDIKQITSSWSHVTCSWISISASASKANICSNQERKRFSMISFIF